MKIFQVIENKEFISREYELTQIEGICKQKQASIITVYGRRRVGKTELIEQSFRKRNLLKFEGIEGLNQEKQIQNFLEQLAQYSGDLLLSKLQVQNWKQVFEILAKYCSQGKWTLFFEELQWLANYKSDFVAALKYIWDNQLKNNSELILVLCGSAPTFMINQVLKSKSLYNRSQHEIPLQEFDPAECSEFFGKNKSYREVMDAYLSVGGIPEYLKYLKGKESIFISLCKNSFRRGSFFSHEYERIFVSSLANNKNYVKIIRFLSKRKFATRAEISKHLKTKSGGSVTELLRDLELCSFIQKYVPFNLSPKSLLARYSIADHYLQFYFKFIENRRDDIDLGAFNKNSTTALNMDEYSKFLGFAFERFIRKNHAKIATHLGFGAVKYKSGSFFNRQSEKQEAGYQLDLVFDRQDHVLTVCEIKYQRSPCNKKVIREFEKKLELFEYPASKSLHKVLICIEAEKSLQDAYYFDQIIYLSDFFA